LTVTGTNSSEFSVGFNGCVNGVAAASNCKIGVIFAPSGLGTRTATLNIADNALDTPQTVSLSGTGAGPVIAFSPASLSFAAEAIGTTSQAQTVTVSNTGNGNLDITSVSLTGTNGHDFAETNTCATAVSPGGTCTVSVTFSPTGGGTRSASLSLLDNAQGSPQTVSLTGLGADFTLAATTPTQTIAAGQTASYALSVNPTGGFNQTVSLACGGNPSASTCAVSPTSVTLNGSTAASITVNVATTARSLFGPRHGPPTRQGPRGWPESWPQAWWVLLAALGSLVIVLRALRRGRRVQFALAATLLLLLAAAACGGGSPSTPVGTPAGTYNITVTGTVGSGGSAVSHQITLTLTVN